MNNWWLFEKKYFEPVKIKKIKNRGIF